MTLRLGLCCQFADAPITFRTATHRYVSGLSADVRLRFHPDQFVVLSSEREDAGLARGVPSRSASSTLP